MSGLCMCGATDCIRCYPDNFERGILMVDLTCDECGCDWEADTLEDRETGLCDDCRAKRYRELMRDHVRGELDNVFDSQEGRHDTQISNGVHRLSCWPFRVPVHRRRPAVAIRQVGCSGRQPVGGHMQIMLRHAEDDFTAMTIANAMMQVGAEVVSITDAGGQPFAATIGRFIVWAKVRDEAHISEVDAIIDSPNAESEVSE